MRPGLGRPPRPGEVLGTRRAGGRELLPGEADHG